MFIKKLTNDVVFDDFPTDIGVLAGMMDGHNWCNLGEFPCGGFVVDVADWLVVGCPNGYPLTIGMILVGNNLADCRNTDHRRIGYLSNDCVVVVDVIDGVVVGCTVGVVVGMTKSDDKLIRCLNTDRHRCCWIGSFPCGVVVDVIDGFAVGCPVGVVVGMTMSDDKLIRCLNTDRH